MVKNYQTIHRCLGLLKIKQCITLPENILKNPEQICLDKDESWKEQKTKILNHIRNIAWNQETDALLTNSMSERTTTSNLGAAIIILLEFHLRDLQTQ